MISKFLLLLLFLLFTVRTQGQQGQLRNLSEANMMGGNQDENINSLSSNVPSHNKPGAVIASSIERQQHKNGTVGVMKDSIQKNITFVEGLSRNISIKHVTADQRLKTQIEQISPSESSKSGKIQNRAQLSKKSEITSPISKQVNNDQKDQKQFPKVKQQIQIKAQPANISLKEGNIPEKYTEKQSQQQTQIVKIAEKQTSYKKQSPQQKIQTEYHMTANFQDLVSDEQMNIVAKSQQKDTKQESITDAELNLNKTETSEISIQIIQSVSQQQVSEQIHAKNYNQSVIKETNSPVAVEIFKVLQETKVQNKTVQPEQIKRKKQAEQTQVVPPAPQKIQGQIKIIQMDNDDQGASQQQKTKVQSSQPVINPPVSQITAQLEERIDQNKQNNHQTINILPVQKKQEVGKKQILQQISNTNIQQPQLQIIDEQAQVKVQIIEINSETSAQKQPTLQQNTKHQQQNIQEQTIAKDLQSNSLPDLKDTKNQQQIINEFQNEQKQSQSDINLQGLTQNIYTSPFNPKQQDKYTAIPQQTIIDSGALPHEEANKKQELQVLLTTVKQNLEGKAKVDLIEHLQKQIKLTEQIKAIEDQKIETKLSIHRQSQYANLKESEAIQKDLELPPQQNMDAQTVIVIIVLTFIISIPIVKQIRQKPNKNEPQKRKQSTNTQMGYTQDNQSGFQVDQTFDQQYLGQVSKNPNQRAWQRQIEEA